MKLDELGETLRIYETAGDRVVLPGLFMVARLDGRGFTRLTKEVCEFEKPFDVRFRDVMVETTKQLMTCGFGVVYGYTQSDEISLLMPADEPAFGRNVRKLISVLAGEASARFSVQLGKPAAFDCRISELPTTALVRDYFRWRNEDAARNALNGHCYWALRGRGESARQATSQLERLTVAQKNELLFTLGTNFNALPSWQKRGVGVFWKDVTIDAMNPVTGQAVAAERRRLTLDYELPMRDAYSDFIEQFVSPER